MIFLKKVSTFRDSSTSLFIDMHYELIHGGRPNNRGEYAVV